MATIKFEFIFVDTEHAELCLESTIHDISCHLSGNNGCKILLLEHLHTNAPEHTHTHTQTHTHTPYLYNLCYLISYCVCLVILIMQTKESLKVPKTAGSLPVIIFIALVQLLCFSTVQGT